MRREADSADEPFDVGAAIRAGSRELLDGVRAFDPIIDHAISVAEQGEHDRRTKGFAYECPACYQSGHAWAGAFFLHLITCPEFRKGKTVDADG